MLFVLTTSTAAAASLSQGAPATPLSATAFAIPSTVTIHKTHNFSGYAVNHAGKVASVSADFTVPKVHGACPSKTEGAFVGIEVDGASGRAIAFAATQSSCSSGHAGYESYLIVYPYAYVGLLAVSSGDRMEASATFSTLTHLWTVDLVDRSTSLGEVEHSVVSGAKGAEAYWGVFAAYTVSTGKIAPLTNFGNVTLTSCYGAINGTASHPLGHYPLLADVMYNKASTGLKATVGVIASNNLSFKVYWKSAGP